MDLDIRGLEAKVVLDGRLHHRQAVTRLDQAGAVLVRRRGARYEHHLAEFEVLQGRLRGDQVPRVNRVERPAEEPDPRLGP
jgi:hypothetical protein